MIFASLNEKLSGAQLALSGSLSEADSRARALQPRNECRRLRVRGWASGADAV